MADDCLPETCEDDTSDDTCIVVDNPSQVQIPERLLDELNWRYGNFS